MNKTIVSKSVLETQTIAQTFAKTLKAGDVVAFSGELGYGKTTFIQGLAKGLGIEKRIISPTFMIVRQYRIMNYELRIKNDQGRIMNFYHIDLYRTKSVDEMRNLGIDEILNDKNAIVSIEWAEKLGALLPKTRIDIKIDYVAENEREIIITKFSI